MRIVDRKSLSTKNIHTTRTANTSGFREKPHVIVHRLISVILLKV
jgi:hypothetical protein